MRVRSFLLLALLAGAGGCVGVLGEEEAAPAPVEQPCPAGEVRQEEGGCAPCGPGLAVRDGACGSCAAREVIAGGRCVPCDDSCAGLGCGEPSQCGTVCTYACWKPVLRPGAYVEATQPCGSDPSLPSPPSPDRPVAREDACVAFDVTSGRFLLFGGERIDNWKEGFLPQDASGRVDDRRSCALRDSWTVEVSGQGEASFVREAPAVAPPPRTDLTCVSTPQGVLLFGGVELRTTTEGLTYLGGIPEDLWLWADGGWQLQPHVLGIGYHPDPASPATEAPRRAPAAWDPERGELVVVGGCRSLSVPLEQVCAGDPSAPLECVGRDDLELNGFDFPFSPGVAWDPVGRRMLVVGGTIAFDEPPPGTAPTRSCPSGGENPASSATWELTRGTAGQKKWLFRQLEAAGPAPAEASALASGASEILRVHGIDRDPTVREAVDQACLWDGAGWACSSELGSSGGPPGRDSPGLAAGDGRYLLVGGNGTMGISLGDAWLFTPPPVQ